MRKVVVAVVAALLVLVAAGTPAHASAPPGAHPVIIVAGTFSPAWANEPLAARLRHDGYRVWIFELPGLGLGDIRTTAAALNTFADSVRVQTGAPKVDLVGHSQGGLVSRAYIKYHGGATEVDSAISLGTPNYGTALANILDFFDLNACEITFISCEQMSIGSLFLGDLNAGDDTIDTVPYTNLYTLFDELVQPVSSAKMNDGATNLMIQSQCWGRVVGHVGLIVDGGVYSGVEQALRGITTIDLKCWAW